MTDSQATHSDANKPLTVCVVCHTHWDREWYHSAGRFRQGLVALVDALFARPETDAFPFLLDGQAVVLEDYLAVRPEMTQQLGAALRGRLIEAGPWYVLADGLIPSGEAIIRNLLVGRRVLRRFGALAPAVAYCPDTFGHSAAIPAIAHGFGFPLAIVWRGYGGACWPAGDVARWQSGSGESVLLYHMPPDGYETGSAWPHDATASAHRWQSFRALMSTRSTTGVVLLPNGADHHALQPNVRDAIAVLQQAANGDEVVRESLNGFAQRVVRAATHRNDIPKVSGELRDSYGYTWTLGGTFGTRAAQKRANAKAERLLLRDVEPWLVLAWLHARPSANEIAANATVTLAQAPALLDAAWRTLLRAHPHDTLCGCSIDAVARAMDVRVESAVLQARGLRRVALNLALQHDAVDARSGPLAHTPSVVIRNRCARWRGGVAELLIDETMADVPVGPSSAGALSADPQPATRAPFDIAGAPVQIISSALVYRRRESSQHYPDNDLVRAHRALVRLPPVPPSGLAVHLIQSAGADAINPSISTAAELKGDSKNDFIAHPVTVRVLDNDIELSNGLVTVVAGTAGVRITRGARTLHDALTVESSRDVGDSYTPAIRGQPEKLRIVAARAGLNGPIRASATLQFATNKKRNGVQVRATVILDANSPAVRVDIAGNNQRRDHRLRVNFNTDEFTNGGDVSVWADAAFGPVERPLLDVPTSDQTLEMVPPTMPMHRWATMSTAHLGATLHADGLAEVEADRKSGALSLTLLRAIGELSKNDLPERPGHAGWPSTIPMAQSIGNFHARIAMHVHAEWSQQTRDEIEVVSDDLLLPLVGETMRDLANASNVIVGPQLSGTALRVSTIALADDGDGIVLRCVNDSNESQNGSWMLPQSVAFECARARMDETLESAWIPSTHEFPFSAAPREIVTIRARRSAI